MNKGNIESKNDGNDKSLTVAFVIDIYPTISTFIMNQIDWLIEKRQDVFIFPRCRNFDNPLSDSDKYKGIVFFPVLYLPKQKKLFFKIIIRYLLKYFLKNPKQILNSFNFFKFGKDALNFRVFYSIMPFLGKKIDIVQVHFGVNGEQAVLLKKVGFNVKIFTMFHGYDIRLGEKKGGKIYDELFKYGDVFQSISDYNTKNLLNFGLEKSKLIKHPVGINIDKIRYFTRTKPSFSEPVIILTVGRFVWEKGYEFAFNAIKMLIDCGVNIRYRIIGDGYLKKELMLLAEQLKIAEYIDFLGQLENAYVLKELEKGHIFLLPSVAEALPVVLMEAQAAGLPVVSTDVGSVNELVINGKSGYIVPSKNAKKLFEKLSYLIDNAEEWSRMGELGQKHIVDNFNINDLNHKLLEKYKEIKTI